MMRATEFVIALVRLGLVLGLVLLGVAVLVRFQPPAATTAASVSPSSLVVPPTKVIPSNVSRADDNPPRVDHALIEAAAMMIPAPPETETALQGIDPRRLRTSLERGMAAMQKFTDDEPIGGGSDDEKKIEGARLVNAAASLGYEPARTLIARDYARSHILRSAVSASDAVRYSLDPLFASGAPGEGARALTLLAAYFSGRQELGAFAVYIVEALRDDRRLQTEDRIKFLLSQLAHVRGACMAISRAIAPTRIATGEDCPPVLQQQVQLFVRVAAPAGREAESRRQASRLLESPNRF